MQSKQALNLYELVGRRNDLKQMLIAEKNRSQSPRADLIKSSCVKMIEVLGRVINSTKLQKQQDESPPKSFGLCPEKCVNFEIGYI